ncbi:uncharacterized protein LOC143583964 [Bidens hawaiensis]|uniref:uncharacterized protein LOC143583964 n=1 Tax=Bidens hawaiensis TaxID=980011 RepID=UPI00404B5D31
MDKIHPAVTVTNIKNFIPLVLETESSHYNSWAELFRIHCRAFEVTDHIDPKAPKPASSSTDKNKAESASVSPALWSRLDAIVLQWIYATISHALLHTILKPQSTAVQAWTTLENIFKDNQATRAVYLGRKFASTRGDDFPNMSAYCQALKMLSDQLANVNAPVEEDRLVIQLITALNENYESKAQILEGTTPLPSFYEARSKLINDETRKQHQATISSLHSGGTALHASNNRTNDTHYHQPDSHVSYRGRGRGRGGRGKGRSSSSRGRGYSG